MSIVLIILIAVPVGIAAIYLYVQNLYNYWHRCGVPVLKPSFPFGNFKKPFLKEKSLSETIKEIYKSSNERFLGIYAFVNPLLFVRDPETIHDILLRNFSSFSSPGFRTNPHIDPMTNNLLFQKGEKWRQNRVKLTHTFTSCRIKENCDIIINSGASLIDYVDDFAKSGKLLEMRDVFARFLTNVIASAAFGIEVDCIKNLEAEFRRYGQRIFSENSNSTIDNFILKFREHFFYQY